MRTRVFIRFPGRVLEPETVRLEDEHTLSATVELEDNTTEIDGLVIDFFAQRAFADGEDLELTNNQWKLFQLLARNPRRFVPHGELKESLGWPRASPTNTVQETLSRVRARLQGRLDGPWVVNRKGVGYALRP